MRASGNLPRASTIIASVKLTIDSRAVLENFWMAKTRQMQNFHNAKQTWNNFLRVLLLQMHFAAIVTWFESDLRLNRTLSPLRIASHCPTSRCFSEPTSETIRTAQLRTMSDRFSCIRSQRMMVGERLEACTTYIWIQIMRMFSKCV